MQALAPCPEPGGGAGSRLCHSEQGQGELHQEVTGESAGVWAGWAGHSSTWENTGDWCLQGQQPILLPCRLPTLRLAVWTTIPSWLLKFQSSYQALVQALPRSRPFSLSCAVPLELLLVRAAVVLNVCVCVCVWALTK